MLVEIGVKVKALTRAELRGGIGIAVWQRRQSRRRYLDIGQEKEVYVLTVESNPIAAHAEACRFHMASRLSRHGKKKDIFYPLINLVLLDATASPWKY